MNINIRKTIIAIFIGVMGFLSSLQSQAELLELSNVPIFMSTPRKPNVLLILDNSNSMDEDENGAILPDDPAVAGYDGGSANVGSKSEQARSVLKTIINQNQDKLNIGLMAYKQYTTGANAVKSMEVHNAFVDISYSPSNFDPNWTGALASPTKKFEFQNPTDPTNYFYTNVIAPFYEKSDQGSAFCYSTTAQALHTIEDAQTGPWDKYRCFSSKTGTSNDLPLWGNRASETATGYSGYKFRIKLSPTDSDLAKGIYDFGRFLHWQHIGKSWYSNRSPGRGYLHVPIAPVDALQKSKLDTKLGTSQFAQNKPIDPNFPLQNAGLTPLEGTLKSAKDYFSKNAHPSEGYSTAVCNALPESCNKNYVILVTDGLPSVAEDGSPDNSISKVATAAQELKAAGIKTYVVGFALPFGTDPNQLNSIAISGDTNYAYNAANQAELEEAMHAILSDIIRGEASLTPISISNQSLTSTTTAYLTAFNSADWTGDIKAYDFASNGEMNPTPKWTIKNPAADAEDPIPPHTARNIATYRRTPSLFGHVASSDAVSFLWSELHSSQKALILGHYCPSSNEECNAKGEAIVNYLRGDDSNIGTGYHFRYRNNLLGDIIHSEPAYVKEPFNHYPDSLETKKYSEFKENYKDRQAMLYVGANDGMLHAFNADTGVEQFAYIPSVTFDHVSRLASPAYAHEYFVDGSPIVADAFYGNDWHTVLAGGFRAGGQGIYAIDVTDPNLNTPTLLTQKMLWEFSDYEDSDMGYSYSEPNIVKLHHGRWAAIFGNGYNNTTPDGRVSTTGHAVLFIHELEKARSLLGTLTGDDFIKIDTGVGDIDNPNGLASVAPVDINGDKIIDYVYAGDLRGNLWKFDLTHCEPVDTCSPQNTLDKWQTAGNPQLLFQATDKYTGEPQPITVRPEVGRHRTQPGMMIYFGTGKYLENKDNTRENQITQTMYAIWDKNDGSQTQPLTRADLQERKILTEVVDGVSAYRIISAATDPTQSHSDLYNQPGYTTRQDDDIIKWGDSDRGFGWAIDFQVGSGSNEGERMINRARLKDGRIVFSTMLPTADACSSGGDGYLMEVDAMQGSRTKTPVYDINGDGQFDNNDKKTVVIDGESVSVPVSGIKLDVGVPAPPRILGVQGKDVVVISGTSTLDAQDQSGANGENNGVQYVGRKSSQPLGRQSWRQCY